MSRGSPEATLREAGHDPGLFLGGRNATAVTAYETLKAALADQATWTQRAAGAKELLAAMLGSRRQAAKLALEYDIRCASHAPGPPRPSQRPGSSAGRLIAPLIVLCLGLRDNLIGIFSQVQVRVCAFLLGPWCFRCRRLLPLMLRLGRVRVQAAAAGG